MRVPIVLLVFAAAGAPATAQQRPIAMAPAASFDLADLSVPPSVSEPGGRLTGRSRYLPPELALPPGIARKPAKLRIRGRKIKLRVPI